MNRNKIAHYPPKSSFFCRGSSRKYLRTIRSEFKPCHGEGNEVINANLCNRRLRIRIYGNRNKCIIRAIDDFAADIEIGSPNDPSNDCTVTIGKDTTARSLFIRLMDDGSPCNIGEDCMFSDGIEVRCTDSHSIIAGIPAKIIKCGVDWDRRSPNQYLRERGNATA